MQTLTTDQRNKIHNLKQAMWSLQKAKQHIVDALGGSDVEQWYSKDLQVMLEELESDIDAITDTKE